MTGSTSLPSTAPRRVVGRFGHAAPGPTLVCVGGLHANEPAGIAAAERVIEQLHDVAPESWSGRLVALAGNVRGLARGDPNLRYVDADLNRMWRQEEVDAVLRTPWEILDDERREQRELAEALQEALSDDRPGLLVDMHTVSAASPPFAFVEDSLSARAVAQALRIPIVLGFEEELHGLLADWVTTVHGRPSIVVEGGRHEDPRSVDVHEAALWVLLDAMGMCTLEAVPHRTDPREVLARASEGRGERVYDIRHRYVVRDDSFEVEPTLDAFDRISMDRTVVARESGRDVLAPMTGLLFMPNRQSIRRPEDDGFFVVRRVGRGWLAISAWLRRRATLHRLLPSLAPGVRPDPDDPNRLLVEPEIAAILKRQVFHLLGYRLVRFGEVRHQHRLQRVASGVRVLVASTLRMLSGLVRTTTPCAPTEPEWIVARRRLDRDPMDVVVRRDGTGAP